MIVLDSDLLAEYSSHKPRASVAPQPINRLEKARTRLRTIQIILLHFIQIDNEIFGTTLEEQGVRGTSRKVQKKY